MTATIPALTLVTCGARAGKSVGWVGATQRLVVPGQCWCSPSSSLDRVAHRFLHLASAPAARQVVTVIH
jgi:hypothetical protein